jgi:molybdopterin-guanine dinucleotide biosynthesis protein A
MPTRYSAIAGCIIAGGQSRRMGEDKARLELGGSALIERAIRRLTPQVACLIINAHEGSADFENHGLPVVRDLAGDRKGPLAGILAAMRWAEKNDIAWIVTIAVDTPFFPRDLVSRLAEAAQDKELACASSAGRLHPVFGLWKASLAQELERQIENGLRSVRQWVGLHDAGIAQWPAEPYDPFFNINSPADMAVALGIETEFRP